MEQFQLLIHWQKKTIFNSDSHDAWSVTYDPNYRENGRNIYEWMLQYLRPAQAALPVSFSDYNALLLPDKAVELTWTTTFEENNAWFIIEHSADGQTFQEASRIKASNISAGSSYKYIHRNPVTGTNFFRLKQLDADGKTTVFKILKVEHIPSLRNTLQIFPNPAVSQLNIEINNSHRGDLEAHIIEISGKVIDVRYFTKRSDYWKQSLYIGGLAPGNYILELKGNDFRNTKNFLKK